jgi:MFS family permease
MSIWVLGFGSLFMDTSSELVHSLLPVYMATILGASMVTIGFIEGIAEATAAITKVFSGVLSDYLGKRKFLVVLGYALGAVTKPVFPLATSIGWVFGARFVDRVGKGIRGAPRDALVADITPPELLGAAYGLRQSLDSVGAFIGPLLARFHGLVGKRHQSCALGRGRAGIHCGGAVRFCGARTWVGISFIEQGCSNHTCGRAATGIELLARGATRRRIHTGALQRSVPRVARAERRLSWFCALVLIAMNVVYAAAAYPAGVAADRISRWTLMLLGLAMLVLADLVLAMAATPWQVFAGAALWGLHMGLTQGLLSKQVADNAPAMLRGTAFGIFNLVSGVAMLLASVVAGALWELVGPSATFIAGAAFAAIAALGILAFWRRPGAA